jgi:hypothetical protein
MNSNADMKNKTFQVATRTPTSHIGLAVSPAYQLVGIPRELFPATTVAGTKPNPAN